jgi:hypothetical protein
LPILHESGTDCYKNRFTRLRGARADGSAAATRPAKALCDILYPNSQYSSREELVLLAPSERIVSMSRAIAYFAFRFRFRLVCP